MINKNDIGIKRW